MVSTHHDVFQYSHPFEHLGQLEGPGKAFFDYLVSRESADLRSSEMYLALGGLVAADAHLPHCGVIITAAGCGLLIGYANGVAMAEARLGAASLLGIAAAGFVAAALVPAFVVSLRQAWMRIAVRVAGSWMVALGLLMVAWSL